MIDSDEKILQKQRLIDAEQKKLEDMQEEIQRLNSNVWYGTAAIMRNFGITV